MTPLPTEGSPLLSVVVPAFNEAATLAEVIQRLLATPEVGEIIIVDDCSTDGTAELADQLAAAEPSVKAIHHKVNAGKTEALKTGFALTTGKIVIVQDADLEYDPADISKVIEPILHGRADVVYGSRFLVRKEARVLYFYHYIANRTLTFLSNPCTNVNMTDVETCYKAFRGDIIRNMVITSSGFGFEIEVTAKVAKLGCAIYEVPISYHGRTYEQGKKIGLEDGLAALWYIFQFNFLCGLRQSFRVLPDTEGTRTLDARTEARRPSILAALGVLFFIIVSCVFIPAVGIEDDEVLFARSIYNPSDAQRFVDVAGHRLPLMLMDYLGADKVYFYKRLLKIFHPNVWTLRLPVVFAGALCLWFLYRATSRVTGKPIAAGLVWLIAMDPMFLLTNTYDWGPVAIQHLLTIAAFALLARPRPWIVSGFFALGFAVWDKGTAIWIIGAMALSALVFYPLEIRKRLSLANLVRACIGFGIGAFPFLLFNVKNHWATFFGQSTQISFDHLGEKVRLMWMMLNGRALFGWLVKGETPAWYLLTPFAIVAAAALIFHPRVAPVRRFALFALATGLLIWAAMLPLKDGGTGPHHAVLIWPWPHLFAVCVLGYALSKKQFAIAMAAVILSGIIMLGMYKQRASHHGPGTFWSDATLRIPELIPQGRPVTTVEWGIFNSATFLTRGQVPIEDITWSGLRPQDIALLDQTEFLTHAPGEEIRVAASPRFDTDIAKLGYTKKVDQVLSDRHGHPMFMSFHCVRK